MVTILDFPLPPSVNNYLMPVIGKVKFNKFGKPYGSGRLVKTKEHKDYEAECQIWALRYQTGLRKLKEEILMAKRQAEANKQPYALKAEYFIMLHKDKVLGSGNQPSQTDTDNFLKPLQDNLFKILNIDDRYVFRAEPEKVYIDQPDQRECVIIRITSHEPRSSSQIIQLVKGQ